MHARMAALAVLIAAAAAARLLPHPPNLTPIAAMALFGGASFSDARAAVAVPLAAMLLSDLFLGLHATIPFVYVSFLLITGIGVWLRRASDGTLLRTRRAVPAIAGAALAGSVVFFLVTNFGAWATTALYPKTSAGLWAAYVAGVPFFRNTLIGDLAYCALLFGGFALMERAIPALRLQPVPVPGR